MAMTDQIAKLRAIADFAEKNGLADHISTVVHLMFDPQVQVYEGESGSSIAVLLPWAEAMDVRYIKLKEGGSRYHMHVVGEIPGAGTVTIVNVSSLDEAREIRTAALSDGMTPLPLVRACMVTEDGAA